MAGGNVSVKAGGSFNSQIGTFGQGNLQIYSGGDVSGRFYVKNGQGIISSLGNFGSSTSPQLIEMGWSNVSVAALGNVGVAAVENPNLALQSTSVSSTSNGYAPFSSVSLTAVTGDVNLGSTNVSYLTQNYDARLEGTNSSLLPPTVSLWAGQSIVVNSSFTQLPAGYGLDSLALTYYGHLPYGGLTMNALTGDIVFVPPSSWIMSDADMNATYPTPYGTSSAIPDLTSHAPTPVHTGDPSTAVIQAGGDIDEMALTLPMAAAICAEETSTTSTTWGKTLLPHR